ncbi:MAG: DinB family protein [Leeuwenhoekiella sp.]
MNWTALNTEEYNPFYANYVKLVPSHSGLIEALEEGEGKTISFFKAIPEDKLKYAYAEGKWTILEILQHIIDTERIFCYRALCIARKDKNSFPGFEQDDYVKPSMANERSLESLLEEYKIVRKSTILLFKSFDKEALIEIGNASKSALSARAAGFIISGHEIHHANIIKERYF